MALFGTLNAECGQNASVHIEYLYAVIVRIGNDNPIGIRYGNVVWMLQLALLLATRSEFAHECAVGLENLQGRRKKSTANERLIDR